MSTDLKWLEESGWSGYIRDVCKHCELDIISKEGLANTWFHAEGYQRGLNRCALKHYGYDAAPVRDPCSHACLGSVTGVQGIVEEKM